MRQMITAKVRLVGRKDIELDGVAKSLQLAASEGKDVKALLGTILSWAEEVKADPAEIEHGEDRYEENL